MKAGDGLVFSSLQSLLRLQAQVRTLNLAKRHALAKHVGIHRSNFKGRGMDFAESRPYQPGDDVRTIDWRVTARTGKVHTKVFQEEREKPVLVWLDLRSPMFFGTRGCFKSVVAAEVTALLLWKTISEGDRAGGMLQDDADIQEFKPSRSRSSALDFMRQLSTVTQNDPVKESPVKPEQMLLDSWRRLRRVAEPGTQVFVISDFRAVSDKALSQLAMINRQSQLVLVSIRDPFEDQLPEQERLRLTDGSKSLWINLRQKLWRKAYEGKAERLRTSLRQFTDKHQIPLIQLMTNDSVTERLFKMTRGIR
uniref:DUF58 domain-containing protein n=1 Tax=uncultured Thiotrichaceae bacterium TaxID=298394 RepID=A0A6S6SJ61_9GAMM|nr:MAG: hypothetical protein PA3071 [uncultured Thiotrichaceae bacterium]